MRYTEQAHWVLFSVLTLLKTAVRLTLSTVTRLTSAHSKKRVVIIEGVFLQRKELCGVFDYMIYIDIPEEVRLTRVLRRDGYIGDDNQIKLKYDNRYFPAERHYVRECAPVQNADFVIEE